ncbi:MAG TPA: chromosome partitioning protein, partial [Pseudomonas sp.]|nr:chromosome partitioning protein [Pseudomonas sp.]
DDIILIEEAAEESEEDALARAIAEEKELEA